VPGKSVVGSSQLPKLFPRRINIPVCVSEEDLKPESSHLDVASMMSHRVAQNPPASRSFFSRCATFRGLDLRSAVKGLMSLAVSRSTLRSLGLQSAVRTTGWTEG